MESEQKLKNWVDDARHWLASEKKRTQPGDNAERLIEKANELAKALFALGRFYYDRAFYDKAIEPIKEAQEMVGPSTESKYFLADSLAKSGKWEDAYEVLRAARLKTGLTQWRHPLYDDPELILDALNSLYPQCMDGCSRLQQPVKDEEFNNWHWNKRFKDHDELRCVAQRYHPFNSEFAIAYHPFDFILPTRAKSFQGLTDKGIPFELKGNGLEQGKNYQIKAGYLLTIPQTRYDIEDAISFLGVTLL